MTIEAYREKAARLATRDSTPTLTDQSQADETNINVIVKRYGNTGQAPGTDGQPEYRDWTEFPDNLRDAIEQARSVQQLRQKLPKQLAEMPMDQLLQLTPDRLTAILTPPAPTPEPTPAPKAPDQGDKK